MAKNEAQKVTAKVFGWLSAVFAVVLLVVGLMAYQFGSSSVKMVNDGLTDYELYFPSEGDPTFAPEAFPDAQKYAGKQVTDGDLARAYAEDYLRVQGELLGNGKTLTEVNTEAAMNPTNTALQQQANMMFQVSTSENLLLVGGYQPWYQAMMIKQVGVVLLAVAAVLAVVSVVFFARRR